jgi:ABC-type phosphate transport system permease subunit
MTDPANKPALPSPAGRVRRRTPLAAHGEPAVWLMGVALLLCLVLIVGLIGIIVVRGGRTFWPNEIQTVTLRSGETFLGQPQHAERYLPGPEEQARIEELLAAGELAEDVLDDEGRAERRRYRVGNRDLGQQSFRSVPTYEIESIEHDPNALLVERRQWGVFLGIPEGVYQESTYELGPEDEPNASDPAIEREIIETLEDGTRRVRERRWIAQGAGETIEALPTLHAEAMKRRSQIDRINEREAPRLQERLTSLAWARRAAQMRANESTRPRLPLWAWVGLSVLAAGSFGGVLRWSRSRTRAPGPDRRRTVLLTLAWGGVVALAGAAVLESPMFQRGMSEAKLAKIEARISAQETQLRADQAKALATVDALRAADARWRVLVREPRTDRFSPMSQSRPDEPMTVSHIVRAVPANRLSLGDKVGVYLSRWWEFVAGQPRENASEGGVFPVIVGTVTLTLLLTISVVPLGVIAAIYLREYARQGLLTSVIRIAVNNLAGVPSIVYGMFGLGFFCYTLGGYVDAGPAAPVSRLGWWGMVGATLLVISLATLLTLASARQPGKPATRFAKLAGAGSAAAWLGVVVLAIVLVAKTPYFQGLFRERLPEDPTFGGRGILWASLTLALMTLPVVIVATEEAISAVPGSMREGSLACGATRWQTIRRIVLPAAQPGIMTGAILAMARGAGEVAPLMLVGAVNLAPALPVSADAPFLHADRTFMHLGFHIYNLGFQNPDSEATEPLVWTTTLLLISIVLALNFAAIIIRGRLRARSHGASV